jgi:hypothetical protein
MQAIGARTHLLVSFVVADAGREVCARVWDDLVRAALFVRFVPADQPR